MSWRAGRVATGSRWWVRVVEAGQRRCARLAPPLRNDASTIIGMQSPVAFAVVAWMAFAILLTSGYGSGGVQNWPVFAVAVTAAVLGAAGLILAPGNPMNLVGTAASILAPPVAVGLAALSSAPPPSSAFGTVTGAASATAAFLCVRGRVLGAWMSYALSIGVSMGIGAAFAHPMTWVPPQIPSVAVVLMATLFAAIIRPAAREIYALRAQAVRDAAEEAAVVAALGERDQQLGRLDEQARQLLESIATGNRLSALERARCRLTEARLRDGIRARSLADAETARQVWAARARGVAVTLLDDRGTVPDSQGADLTTDPALPVVRDRLVTILHTLDADASVTVRILPRGREPYATVLVRDRDRSRRTDIGSDGLVRHVTPHG